MTRVYFGVGANLGDRWAALSGAVEGLATLGDEVVVSPIYETEPVGGPSGQDPYLNCVVALSTGAPPRALLARAHELENAAGRVRLERFGPRTLDVDVLIIEGYASEDPELTVPHPRMRERAFVLAPLADLAPELVDADWRERFGGRDAIGALVRPVGRILPAHRGTAPSGAVASGAGAQ